MFLNDDTCSSFSFDKNKCTLEDVKESVKQKWNIKQEDALWRIRAYKKYDLMPGETYTGKELLPLSELLDLTSSKHDFIVEFRETI